MKTKREPVRRLQRRVPSILHLEAQLAEQKASPRKRTTLTEQLLNAEAEIRERTRTINRLCRELASLKSQLQQIKDRPPTLEAAKEHKELLRQIGELREENQQLLRQLAPHAAAPTPRALRRDTASLADDGQVSLLALLNEQRKFSDRTFGPGQRTLGVVQHIRKELNEVLKAAELEGNDLREVLSEWADVMILAMDGAWRTGAPLRQIVEAITAKMATNLTRTWPDWRKAAPGEPIEHIRTKKG